MILIEAGSSSTQVCQVINGAPGSISTYDGISPSYMAKEEIIEVLKQLLINLKPDKEVFYYGTGCHQNSAKAIIRECIERINPFDKIEVATDLLAAARATAQHSDGQINILGTGSASCLYIDKKVRTVFFNSGYLFGDYGSGFHLGQSFLKAYFEDKLSQEIELTIEDFTKVSKQALVQKIYSNPVPKEQVANFAKCIYGLRQDPQVNQIIVDAFSQFIHFQIQLNKEYQSSAQYFVGSIAHYFKDELIAAMLSSDLEIADICHSPIEKLIGFHLT